VTVAGFPIEVGVGAGDNAEIDAPVGVACTVVETDDRGATAVTYAPESGTVLVPAGGDRSAPVTIMTGLPIGAVCTVTETDSAGRRLHAARRDGDDRRAGDSGARVLPRPVLGRDDLGRKDRGR
jgi:hypothetical protein